MTETASGLRRWLDRWEGEPCAYLTTIGRRSGRPHRIEIWFAAEGERLYLMSGGRDRADWVRNILANPHVTVELGDGMHEGIARIVQAGFAEDTRVRELLVSKYATPGNPLDDWGRTSLAVIVEFPADAAARSSPAPRCEDGSRG